MVRPILSFEHPVLREKAKKVTRIDASTLRLLADLTETMLNAPGAGLAANQNWLCFSRAASTSALRVAVSLIWLFGIWLSGIWLSGIWLSGI